jgi:hypothetical protein
VRNHGRIKGRIISQTLKLSPLLILRGRLDCGICLRKTATGQGAHTLGFRRDSVQIVFYLRGGLGILVRQRRPRNQALGRADGIK